MTRNLLLLTMTAGAVTLAGASAAQTPPPSTSGSTPPQAPMTSAQTRWAAGTEVMASDGAMLGVLDTATAAGQGMLRIRAADGTVKTAPAAGAAMMGGHVRVAWTKAEFDAAPTAPSAGAMAPRSPATTPPPATPPTLPPDKPATSPMTPPTTPPN